MAVAPLRINAAEKAPRSKRIRPSCRFESTLLLSRRGRASRYRGSIKDSQAQRPNGIEMSRPAGARRVAWAERASAGHTRQPLGPC